MDYNRDGISDHSFTFGNGNSERGYYTTNGGIAIVRGNAIYIDDNLDGIADRSFTFGNGSSESEYLFMRPIGIAVRRGNLIIWDLNMDGIPNSSFTFGNGNSEDQYSHAPVILGSSGWGLRRDYTWYVYPSGNYSYGNGNQEDGYFFGKFPGGTSYYECAVLRYNTLYYDNDNDGQSEGSFSFGTGLK
ncbi:MAG: hypothetical protein PHW27_10085 [Melioribacteraceae bacterium]|nr:hypothetical protein [Melioribacteraceae bacterium]